MTKEQELVKALKWCIDESSPIPRCEKCKYNSGNNTKCINHIMSDAADLIESQQSTNDNLLAENAMLEADNANLQAEVDRYKRLFLGEHDIANALQLKSEALEDENGKIDMTNSLLMGAVDRLTAEVERLEAKVKEADEIIVDMTWQFCYECMPKKGRAAVTAGGLSALESAFSHLGWDDPHYTPERECDFKGCHKHYSCGTPTESGYKHFCSEHGRLYLNRPLPSPPERNDDADKTMEVQ